MHQRRVKRITFEVLNWDEGFFVQFEVPFSLHNFHNIVAIPGSRNIRIH